MRRNRECLKGIHTDSLYILWENTSEGQPGERGVEGYAQGGYCTNTSLRLVQSQYIPRSNQQRCPHGFPPQPSPGNAGPRWVLRTQQPQSQGKQKPLLLEEMSRQKCSAEIFAVGMDKGQCKVALYLYIGPEETTSNSASTSCVIASCKVGRIDIRLHHVPIAKIRLSPATTPRRTFLQILSARTF